MATQFLLQYLMGPHNQAPAPLPTGGGPWTKVSPFVSSGGGGGSSTSTSNTSYNKNSAPYILPEYSGLMGSLRKQMETRLAGNGLPAGFEENGLRKINDTYRVGEQATQNQLIGRGLLGSPAEATAFTQQFNLPRIGQMSQFRADLPLQQRQFKNEDWSMIQQLLDAFGKGTKESGTSTTTSTSKSGGGGGGQMMNPLYNPTQTLRAPGFFQQLAPFLGQLAGQLLAGGGSGNGGTH